MNPEGIHPWGIVGELHAFNPGAVIKSLADLCFWSFTDNPVVG